MRVLAFRHVPFEGLGHIQTVLEARGVGVECVDLYRESESVPDTSTAAGLIFMGGAMSANDDLPYLRQEISIIRAAIDRGQPVLGVCLGSQLMARALGAAVYPNPRKEIGWFDIELTPAAASDTLFRGIGPTQMVFHWHGETFDLPPTTEWLARSEACKHQAFRAGSTAYGIQFHPEVTPAMLADWCMQDDMCVDLRELAEPPDPSANSEILQALSEKLFGRWASLL